MGRDDTGTVGRLGCCRRCRGKVHRRVELLATALWEQNSNQRARSVGALPEGIGRKLEPSNARLQGTVSSIQRVALAASLMTVVQWCNCRHFVVLGAEVGELELCRLLVGIVVDWEPRSCFQVGIVGSTDLPAGIVGAVVCAADVVARAADRRADIVREICLADFAVHAAAASLGS